MTSEERLPMKRLYLLMIVMFAGIAAFAGCCLGPSPRWAHYESPNDAQHSVYKIKAEMVVDVSSIADDLGLAPDDPTTKTAKWSGTAWVQQSSTKESYIVTAGHVCEEAGGMYSYETVDFEKMKLVEHKLPILSVNYTLIDQDGTEFHGAKVVLDDDSVDLCMLGIAGDLGSPLAISGHDPRYSQEGWYIGAPYGIWGGGIAGVYKVVFSGRGNVFGTRPMMAFSSASAAPGASGSPIMFDGEVVAVLTEGADGFMTYTQGVPRDILQAFCDRAHHTE
jgi:hypothetical protein